jgi:hypothetical protein
MRSHAVSPGRAPRPARLRFRMIERLAVRLGHSFARGERPLDARELEVVQPVFEDSVRYDDVRVVRGYFANAPTTLGNCIRIGLDGALDDATLVHEMTHVWQYQTYGTGYISNSMCAQLAGFFTTGSRNAAYQIRPSQLKPLGSFYELSAERQARTVEHYFVSTLCNRADPAQQARARSEFQRVFGELKDPARDRAEFDAEFVELERMIAQIRCARSLNLNRSEL